MQMHMESRSCGSRRDADWFRILCDTEEQMPKKEEARGDRVVVMPEKADA